MTIDLTQPLRIVGTHEPVTVLTHDFIAEKQCRHVLVSFLKDGVTRLYIIGNDYWLFTTSSRPSGLLIENVPSVPPVDMRYLGVLRDSVGYYVNGIYGSSARCFAMSDSEFCMPAPIIESQLIRRPQP